MANFAAASWNNPIVITSKDEPAIQLIEFGPARVVPPVIYVGDRASTAIRVCQLRLEPELTKEANERGELEVHGDDAVVISVHGVINKIRHQPVINKEAKNPYNSNVFFVEFFAVATDVVIEKVTNKEGLLVDVIVSAKIVDPVYNQPVPVTCNDTLTTILKCSLSLENGVGVEPVLMANGLQKRLKRGKGEPLFIPMELLVHSAKTDNKKKQESSLPAQAPVQTAAPAPAPSSESDSKKRERRTRKRSVPTAKVNKALERPSAKSELVTA